MVAVVASGAGGGDVGWLDPAELVVAADGGAALLDRIGQRPDGLVGDLDSIDRAAGRASGRGRRAPSSGTRDKEASDTELALGDAVASGATEMVMLGAVGEIGSTTSSPTCSCWPIRRWPAAQCGSSARADRRARRASGTLSTRRPFGDLVSLLPIGGDAVRRDHRGAAMATGWATLPRVDPRASNEMVRRAGIGRIDNGTLLVVETAIEGATTMTTTRPVRRRLARRRHRRGRRRRRRVRRRVPRLERGLRGRRADLRFAAARSGDPVRLWLLPLPCWSASSCAGPAPRSSAARVGRRLGLARARRTAATPSCRARSRGRRRARLRHRPVPALDAALRCPRRGAVRASPPPCTTSSSTTPTTDVDVWAVYGVASVLSGAVIAGVGAWLLLRRSSPPACCPFASGANSRRSDAPRPQWRHDGGRRPARIEARGWGLRHPGRRAGPFAAST